MYQSFSTPQIKRDPLEDTPVPILPYVRKFQLIQPPIKEEILSPPSEEHTKCSRKLPNKKQRARKCSKRKRASKSSKSAAKSIKSVQQVPHTKELRPNICYNGNIILPSEFDILLPQVDIFETYPGSGIPEFSVTAIIDKELIVPLKRVDVTYESSYAENDVEASLKSFCANYSYEKSLKFCTSKSTNETLLKSASAGNDGSVEDEVVFKIEPRTENDYQDNHDLDLKILSIPLVRIDQNILFHIRINNPEAAIPGKVQTQKLIKELPSPMKRSIQKVLTLKLSSITSRIVKNGNFASRIPAKGKYHQSSSRALALLNVTKAPRRQVVQRAPRKVTLKDMMMKLGMVPFHTVS